MASDDGNPKGESILGVGFGFPPEFVWERGEARMVSGEEDIQQSLRILFGTTRGERFLVPTYGLDMRELVFEATSTTTRSLLADRIKVAILIHEPRIELLSLRVDALDANAGSVLVSIEYAIRTTNSRYNLVFPFYVVDSNEVRGSVNAPSAGAELKGR
ncbi:GPW/gp25 family protein [Polyangium sp. y55x31]|uniref:GPW/gp25 family protein n=1 Tax=Polyangium sp. y55x31 TaxID=3042688 RepID=UPI002482D8BB|nr:GPW/gp25 family protein [Polyangium sp. y55x31]MDI1478921.1 GPW/gp25 family protein [Polyangium sp. y55x31]